jgi:hypothetical protein
VFGGVKCGYIYHICVVFVGGIGGGQLGIYTTHTYNISLHFSLLSLYTHIHTHTYIYMHTHIYTYTYLCFHVRHGGVALLLALVERLSELVGVGEPVVLFVVVCVWVFLSVGGLTCGSTWVHIYIYTHIYYIRFSPDSDHGFTHRLLRLPAVAADGEGGDVPVWVWHCL